MKPTAITTASKKPIVIESKHKFPADWAFYEPCIFHREISKGQFEYKYRLIMVDGLGKKIDTWRKKDDHNKAFTRLSDCKAHKNTLIKELENRTVETSKSTTALNIEEIFKEYVTKQGSKMMRANSLSKTEGDFYKHILPALGNRNIADISKAEIDNLLIDLSTGGKLAYTTVKSILVTLRKIWTYAAKLGVIEGSVYIDYFTNPVNSIVVNRKTVAKKSSDKVEVYTNEEVQKILDYAEGTPFKMILLLGLNCGMRIGEILGLMWDDIHWEENSITIGRQLIYDKRSNEYCLGPTKNGKSRTIPVSPTMKAVLHNHMEQQEWECIKYGKAYRNKETVYNAATNKTIKSGGFVCRKTNGQYMNHSTTNHFREKIQKNLPDVHFSYHALRHICASRLAASGLSPIYVAFYLGHADTRTTERYYIGETEEGIGMLAKALEATNT